MTERDKTIGTIFIEDQLELYDVLMQDPQGKTLLDSGRGLQVEKAVADLALSWRRTDYARTLPHILVTTIPGVAANAAGATSDSVPARIIGALLSNMEGRLDRGSLRQIEIAVKKMHTKLRRGKRRILEDELRLLAETQAVAWRSMLQMHPFQLALAASEAQAYSTLYFAYESFLGAVMEVRTGDWPETTGAVGDAIRDKLGSRLHNRCWADRRIEAARHARDALAHRDGRVQKSDLLSKSGKIRRKATAHFSDLLHVIGDRIIISATDTRSLYGLLYERVLEVIGAQRAHEAAPTPMAI